MDLMRNTVKLPDLLIIMLTIMFLLIHFNGIVGYCKNYYVVDSEDGYTEINSDSKRVITTNQG